MVKHLFAVTDPGFSQGTPTLKMDAVTYYFTIFCPKLHQNKNAFLYNVYCMFIATQWGFCLWGLPDRDLPKQRPPGQRPPGQRPPGERLPGERPLEQRSLDRDPLVM